MKENIHISVVSPVFRAENIIDELIKQLIENLSSITDNFEIILVEDNSPDNSWDTIVRNCTINKKIQGIKLSRNFGQHYAITAGLKFSTGDWVVVMDCDLQDRPEEIPNLYKKAMEGFDSVFAQRINRKDSIFKRIFSKAFYTFFSYLTETKQDASVANFGIYHRKVIDSILSMGDQIRYFPTMVQWVGFRKAYLPIIHGNRFEGKTSYNYKSLFKLAINNIIAFSDKPLRLIVKFGFIISTFSFLTGFFYLIGHLTGMVTMAGFTSLIISIWFLSGVIILLLGVLGLYLGKIFEKVKNRPGYIIHKTINI